MRATVGRKVLRAALFAALGLGALAGGATAAQASDQPALNVTPASATAPAYGSPSVQPMDYTWD